MKTFILIIILAFATITFANNWTLIGPDTVNVNTCYTSYTANILAISDGILIQGSDDWNKYSTKNLPVWDIAEINDDLILIMGDGSYSDGIYKFNLSDHQFLSEKM